MSYRLRKQIIIALILLLVLALLGVGVYYKWFYRAPTCFDGKQNQKEESVDCGGPCELSCEFLTVKNLEVKWAKAVFLREGLYDVVADIYNVNPNFGLERFNYAFKLFDNNHQLIAEKKGSSFILPNQEKYIIETNVVSDKKIEIIELTIDKIEKKEWQRLKDNFDLPDIYIYDRKFEYLDNQTGRDFGQVGTAQAKGIIRNKSNFNFNKVNVSVVLFDSDKEIIGLNKTESYSISAGEERHFSVLWFSPLRGEVGPIDMLVDTNLFSESNFMQQYGATEKFQEY